MKACWNNYLRISEGKTLFKRIFFFSNWKERPLSRNLNNKLMNQASYSYNVLDVGDLRFLR
jgi:hypothetical protein